VRSLDFPFNPVEIDLRVGLEIHQQLSTQTKLFCACPIVKSEEFPYSFSRRLRPTQSETGRVDPAAAFEFSRGKENVYRWSPESSCVVEADEEPPHPVNWEALETTILIAEMLRSHLVDEVHVMRKIVIDGSNTSGFQRTTVVGIGGHLEVDGGGVGVQTVTLEEDAARILGEDEGARYFALDRLGVPLAEIALDPVTGTPEQIADVALQLGRTLRSTGRAARGLGTIRQDLNVSVKGGRVVEVKGVQKLNLLARVVAYEAARQMGLVKVAEELAKRKVDKASTLHRDVTALMKKTASRAIRNQLGQGGRAVCVVAEGFAGLLGWEPYPGIRLGRELAEVASANSLGGIIHSDEFSKHGLTEEEEGALRKETGASKDAALILLAGEATSVERTAVQLESRMAEALLGVPQETRAATEDGESRFMRPRPGAQRMYPETDIPEIVITSKRAEAISKMLPEPWTSRVERYEKGFSLSRDMALRLYDSERAQLFERVSPELSLEPSVVASVLVEIPTRLSREGVDEDSITDSLLEEVLRAIAEGRIAKEAAPDVVRLVANGEARDPGSAMASLGLTPMSVGQLRALVETVVKKEERLLAELGERAFSPLMGEVMKEARGRIDGQLASKILRETMKEYGQRMRASGDPDRSNRTK